MAKQSDSTKLLAIGLLNLADDEGYFFADPITVRNNLRPRDDSSGITTVLIRELSDLGYISIKNHSTHGPIGHVTSFAAHQVINKSKASKIKHLYDSGINTVSIPDEYRQERKGKEGSMEQGKEDILSDKSDEHEKNDYPDDIKILWKTFPATSRNRSSIAKLSTAWKKTASKPNIEEVINSAKKWAASTDWTKDGGQYAPAADRWIRERRWESEPEATSYVPATSKPAFNGIIENLPLRIL